MQCMAVVLYSREGSLKESESFLGGMVSAMFGFLSAFVAIFVTLLGTLFSSALKSQTLIHMRIVVWTLDNID